MNNIRKSILPIFISVIIITIIYNLNIPDYNKLFILPIILLIITYLYILNKDNMIINNKGYIYLIPIILIILGTISFKTDASNQVLNVIIIPILLSFLFLTLTNKYYRVSENFFKWFIQLFPKYLFTNLNHLKGNIIIKPNRKILSIIIGFIIGIPIIIILLKLLTSADMYFSTLIKRITNGIELSININIIRNNIIIFITYFIIFFSVFINIIKNKELKIEDMKKIKIDYTIINTILIMINLVFTLFVISEISKITGNFLELPEKYTYAMYAREGFFQLLVVTVINFSIILFLLYKTDIIKENKLLKNLIILLISFTIILIFNSYYRMYLYMYEFGFTILRTQVILFLTMELILLILIIKKILHNLKYSDSDIFTIVIITTYILNIYLCNSNVINYINRIINKI